MYSFEQWFSKRKNWVCPFTGGSKKSHNWFPPLTGVLRNSKTHVTEPTLIHQFFHHFENHHFLKNFTNPNLEILLILKLFKNQNWRFWGSGNFQKVELAFLWFVKLKKPKIWGSQQNQRTTQVGENCMFGIERTKPEPGPIFKTGTRFL
jgi:hypothetical protein